MTRYCDRQGHTPPTGSRLGSPYKCLDCGEVVDPTIERPPAEAITEELLRLSQRQDPETVGEPEVDHVAVGAAEIRAAANGADTANSKPSNPKDIVGSTKLPLGLIPETADIEETMALLEGALKYGRYNWRIAGVRASIYYAALKRHAAKWWNGSDRDPLTRVKHLANARACLTILIDAEVCGMLEDDRPPAVDLERYIDDMADHVAYLKQLFKDRNPKQYTIADSLTHDGPANA